MDAPPKRILFVEDEPLVRASVAMLLELDGHVVVTAGDGEEGLRQFESGAFDVVITDYAMPGMNGGKLAAAIRQLSPMQPIILLTAHAAMLQPMDAVDLIVPKPVTSRLLGDAISRALKKSAAQSPIAPERL